MVGNLTGAIVITKTSGPWFFGICWCIMMSAVFCFSFIVLPKEQEEPELGQMKVIEKKPSFWRETWNTVKLIFTPKMLLMDA